jgi:hypothetical protein
MPEQDLIEFEFEHTDTFGGEANYSWVTRKIIKLPRDISDQKLVRRAKRELGLTGIRHTREDMGETIKLKLHGYHQVVFITPRY